MPTRRAALSAVGLALASLSGCLQETPNDDGPPALDAPVRTHALPAPAVSGDPEVVTMADVDLAGLRDTQGKLTDLEGDLGGLARSFAEEYPQFRPADVDRITGQIVTGSEPGDGEAAAVVVGDFDPDAVETWFAEEIDGGYESGEYDGFEWFAPSSTEDDGVLAVSGDQLVSRSGTEGRASREATVTEAIDAAGSDDRWYDGDEHLTSALSAVEDHPNVVAGAAAPSVTAESAEEVPIEGLAAGAVGTTPRSDGASLDVVARFRSGADTDGVSNLIEAYLGGLAGSDPVVSALEFEVEGRVASASASVDGATLEDSDLEPVVRFLPYYYVTLFPVSSPDHPQVAWEFERRSDGRLEILHAGGEDVQEAVTIRYEADGEVVEETWSEQDALSVGDSYVTTRAGDTGTELTIAWVRDDGESFVLGRHVFA